MVGKTTTSVNLSTAFAAVNKNTLLIDLDHQGNASTGLGFSYKNRTKNIYNVLVDNESISSSILNTEYQIYH